MCGGIQREFSQFPRYRERNLIRSELIERAAVWLAGSGVSANEILRDGLEGGVVLRGARRERPERDPPLCPALNVGTRVARDTVLENQRKRHSNTLCETLICETKDEPPFPAGTSPSVDRIVAKVHAIDGGREEKWALVQIQRPSGGAGPVSEDF